MAQEFRARGIRGNQPLPLKEYMEALQLPQHLDLPNLGLQVQEAVIRLEEQLSLGEEATRLEDLQLLAAAATRLEEPQLLVEVGTELVVLQSLVVVQETEEDARQEVG